jgi:hypothetical protein
LLPPSDTIARSTSLFCRRHANFFFAPTRPQPSRRLDRIQSACMPASRRGVRDAVLPVLASSSTASQQVCLHELTSCQSRTPNRGQISYVNVEYFFPILTYPILIGLLFNLFGRQDYSNLFFFLYWCTCGCINMYRTIQHGAFPVAHESSELVHVAPVRWPFFGDLQQLHADLYRYIMGTSSASTDRRQRLRAYVTTRTTSTDLFYMLCLLFRSLPLDTLGGLALPI